MLNHWCYAENIVSSKVEPNLRALVGLEAAGEAVEKERSRNKPRPPRPATQPGAERLLQQQHKKAKQPESWSGKSSPSGKQQHGKTLAHDKAAFAGNSGGVKRKGGKQRSGGTSKRKKSVVG